MIETWLAGKLRETVDAEVYAAPAPTAMRLPAVTYQRTSHARSLALDGTRGTAELFYEVDCWAEVFEDTKALATEIMQQLHGARTPPGRPERIDFVKAEQMIMVYSGPDRDVRGTRLQLAISCRGE